MTEVEIEDLRDGEGAEAEEGDTLYVHYTGWLENGEEFDSSYEEDEPFAFELGGGDVIEGWDIGLEGMCVGGKRKLTVPARLAYGNKSVLDGKIPANSNLVFEVELISIS